VPKKQVPPKVGDIGPDFTLRDHNSQEVKLSELMGKRVLLSFHPMAWTEVCAMQMQALEENKDVFASLNAAPLGLSVDSVPCKKAWANSLGIKTVPLVADFWPHGGVAIAYGVFREENGFSERANIILDEKGKVIFLKVYDIRQLPDINEVIGFIKGL